MKSLPRPSRLEKLVNLPAGQMRQPVPGADPQAAVPVGVERADEIVGQPVGRSESLYPAFGLSQARVEKVQPVGGSDPKVAAGAAGQRKDDIAGQGRPQW